MSKTLRLTINDTCGRNPLTVRINNGEERNFFVDTNYTLSDADYVTVKGIVDAIAEVSPKADEYPDGGVFVVHVANGKADASASEIISRVNEGDAAFAVYKDKVLPMVYKTTGRVQFSDGKVEVVVDANASATAANIESTLVITLTESSGSYASDKTVSEIMAAVTKKDIRVRVVTGTSAWTEMPVVIKQVSGSPQYKLIAESFYADGTDFKLDQYVSNSFTSSSESVTFTKTTYTLIAGE